MTAETATAHPHNPYRSPAPAPVPTRT
ncbi:transcriptional regulator, partial [Nocardia cyriacigeorgica]|nr:transcriptional regulator [Nocardia cyriacigeorgica]